MSGEDDVRAVEEFAVALDAPLSDADRADGWTEDARVASIASTRRVLDDLDKGWGEHAEYASHHLVRVLDHWGVSARSEGRLANAAAAAQVALIRLRAART